MAGEGEITLYTFELPLLKNRVECSGYSAFRGKEIGFSGFGYQDTKWRVNWPGYHIVLWEEPPLGKMQLRDQEG